MSEPPDVDDDEMISGGVLYLEYGCECAAENCICITPTGNASKVCDTCERGEHDFVEEKR